MLFEVRNIDSFSHVTVGYIEPEMLDIYLEEITKMLFAEMRQLDIGYACSFVYNWSVSGGAER